MTIRSLLWALPLLLVACGTPQERCISRASKELRTFDRLIAETNATLRRGYGLKKEPYTVQYYEDCQTGTDSNNQPIYGRCLRSEVQYREVPVAVDLAAEQVKLDGLVERREQEAARVGRAAEQCRAQFPE